MASCYTTGAGPDPSPTGLYFPVGLAVSPGGGALFVANSDFNLQFNSGTLLTYDLPRLRETLRPLWSPESASPLGDPCIGLGANTNPVLQPGRCGPFDPNAPPDYSPSLVRGSAKIGAFATDLLFVCHPADGAPGGADCPRGSSADPRGARLFVPIRGEPSLTYFDVDDDRNHADGSPAEQTFRLDCGQVGNGRCSDGHRAGVDANDNTRGLTLPAEPFGIAVSQRADAIVVTHQSGGAVSLFTAHGPNGTSVLDVKPTLQFVFGSLPAAATGVAALPVPALVWGLGSRPPTTSPASSLRTAASPGRRLPFLRRRIRRALPRILDAHVCFIAHRHPQRHRLARHRHRHHPPGRYRHADATKHLRGRLSQRPGQP